MFARLSRQRTIKNICNTIKNLLQDYQGGTTITVKQSAYHCTLCKFRVSSYFLFFNKLCYKCCSMFVLQPFLSILSAMFHMILILRAPPGKSSQPIESEQFTTSKILRFKIEKLKVEKLIHKKAF